MTYCVLLKEIPIIALLKERKLLSEFQNQHAPYKVIFCIVVKSPDIYLCPVPLLLTLPEVDRNSDLRCFFFPISDFLLLSHFQFPIVLISGTFIIHERPLFPLPKNIFAFFKFLFFIFPPFPLLSLFSNFFSRFCFNYWKRWWCRN